MKILFVTQWFQPEQFYKGVPFARKLIERGHQVQVLTGFPNYPDGKLYDGYRIRLLQREIMEGIEVLRVPLYPSHDSSAIRRITTYLSFALSATIIGPWFVKRPDIIYVYHPPPTTYLPAFFVKLFKRAPVVYDIQDFWPDTLLATGMLNNALCLKLVDLYCKLFYKFANKLIVLSPGFKQKLIEKGVSEKKIEVIYNWCVESDIAPVKRDSQIAANTGMENRFNILFAGNMGKAQKLETVLESAALLKESHPQIQFVFIGDGIELQNLKDSSLQMKLNNVLFLQRRPRSEIGQILSLADVLLVHLKKDPLFEITIPSKIQAYMAAGKPILAALAGDASNLVHKADCGLSCLPENPAELAEKVNQFYNLSQSDLQRMGSNGRQFYLQNLSMEVGVSKFEKIFKEITAASSR